MPAEWEEHEATWLAWPHNPTDWPDKLDTIRWVYGEIVRKIASGEIVRMVVGSRKDETLARAYLKRAGADTSRVEFVVHPTNRGWTRDSGPIFVRRRSAKKTETAIIHFHFNAWAKYPDWRDDAKASERIVKWAGVRAFRPEVTGKRVVLEGGSIDANGRGLLLATEECLLSEIQSRNPGMSQEELERVLADYLGIEKVIWLDRGITGDDTHGHVDDISRFVAADTVLTAVEPNKNDDNHEPLRVNRERLRQATDQSGRKLQVVDLPMPAPVVFKGRRLPASYANFYIANGAVLVPVFNDKNDRVALNILSDLFPARSIVPIYCGDLVWGLGAIHCMTQQQPGL